MKKMNDIDREEVVLYIQKCMVQNFDDPSRIFQGPIEYFELFTHTHIFVFNLLVFNIEIQIQNLKKKK